MSDNKKNDVQSAEDKPAKKSPKKDKTGADSRKSKKSEKKSVLKRIAGWFKDLKKEFKKVVWPTKKTVINNTLVVLAVVVIGSVVIGLLDLGFLNLMQFLMNLSN